MIIRKFIWVAIFYLLICCNLINNGPSNSEIEVAIKNTIIPFSIILSFPESEIPKMTDMKVGVGYEIKKLDEEKQRYDEFIQELKIEYNNVRVVKKGILQDNFSYPVLAKVEGITHFKNKVYNFSGIVEYSLYRDHKWGDWLAIVKYKN